jgi:hypothetical protein
LAGADAAAARAGFFAARVCVAAWADAGLAAGRGLAGLRRREAATAASSFSRLLPTRSISACARSRVRPCLFAKYSSS